MAASGHEAEEEYFLFSPTFQTVQTDLDLSNRLSLAFENEAEQDGAEGQPLSFHMATLQAELEAYAATLPLAAPAFSTSASSSTPTFCSTAALTTTSNLTTDAASPTASDPTPSSPNASSSKSASPTVPPRPKAPPLILPVVIPSPDNPFRDETSDRRGPRGGGVGKRGPSSAVQKERKKKQSKLRSLWKRQEKAALQDDRCLPDFYMTPRLSTFKHIPSPQVIMTELDPEALPVAQHCWVGKRVPSAKDTPWTYDELIREGFKRVDWDGRKTLVITDKDGRAVVVFAGAPHNDKGWGDVARRAAETMASVRDEGLAANALPLDVQSHRRGEFVALPVGVSHGNGRLQPGNLLQPPERSKLVERLLSDESIQRIAGFQSSLFSYYAPKLYAHYCHRLLRLFKRDVSLQGNFANSVFPATSFNLGPQTVSLDHTDAGNVGYGLCALVSLGNFDSQKGGHLVLFDMGLIIPFPSSSVALLPSGILRHGNTPVQAGETRYSIAQYCAGGLIRWVDYGFKTATARTANMSRVKTKEVLAALNGTHETRVQEALGLFSKVGEMESDRVATFTGFASFLRSNQS